MAAAEPNPEIVVGGERIAPGEERRLEIPVARLPSHTMLDLPVTVVHGRRAGARLWLSAALHGDELNGMEIIRRTLESISPGTLRGTVIAVPIVNVFGFIGQSRYLPDRRDLNRSFPGSRGGSLAAQLAHLFMTEIVARSTHGIDLHTAAPPRTNLPQIRGNLEDAETRRCALAFGAPVTLHGAAPAGSLRNVATRRGIPVLLYEAGEAMRFNEAAIRSGCDGVLRVMAELKMIPRRQAPPPRRTLESARSKWVRASQSGVIYLEVGLGDRVRVGQRLAMITDPLGEGEVTLAAPFDGMVVGHTQNPLVHRGDGVIHLAERARRVGG